MTGETGARAALPWDRADLLDRIDGDEELFREVVAAFQEEAPALIETLARALRERDRRGVEYAAHALKGTLLNVSAGRAATIADRIEDAGRAGDLDGALPWFVVLGPEIDLALEAMAGASEWAEATD